ncbi:MAG: aminopeptidase [Mycobacteriaceae bacterium]|uniref:aminopeptidase n=1 Tax=Corynebacterium sp. TaxID=1720 RepID=UPI003F95AB61
MKRIPNLPRQVPEITVGTAVEGTDVIGCRVVVGEVPETGTGAHLADDGVWEVRVPAEPVPLTDLTDLSEEPRLGEDGWRAAAAVLVRRLGVVVAGHPVRAKRHTVQVSVPSGTTALNLRNLAQGLVLGGRPIVVTRKEPSPEVRTIHIDIGAIDDPTVVDKAAESVSRGRVQGSATALARDLASVPESDATLQWWKRQAKSAIGDIPGTRVKTHGAGWLQRKSFGGLLATAVAEGAPADRDPDGDVGMVELQWDPAAAEGDLTDDRPDVLIVGGAETPAVIRALAELRGPRKVVGLVPVYGSTLPQALPDRTDAVVEHVNGMTTRLNLTADGAQRSRASRRLALADSVAYGVQRYNPRRVVVVAPVAAASKIALGERTGAVFGDSQSVRRVTLRGARVGERWWPMPTPAHLERRVTSREADAVVQSDGPDALTAAMFLRRFAGEVPCTVLDTFGPARSDAVVGEVNRGSTGFAARTLVEWFRK